MKKFIITIMVTMMTLTAVFAETHWVNSKNDVYWTDKYVTNDEEAKELLCELIYARFGLSDTEFEQYKGKYTLDMRGPDIWDGYNKISSRYKTPNATFIKGLRNGAYIVHGYSNGQLRYCNVFIEAKK